MYADSKGVKIWYEIHGQGDPTLVMVPGFQIVHSESFKRNYVPHLSRHMRLVTLDLRGSGKSDKPEEGYDLESLVEDIHAVVDDAGLDRFAMVGMSLGVSLCLTYNANHPEKVTDLILVAGYARTVKSEAYPHGLPEEVLKGSLQFWHDQPEEMLKGFIKITFPEKYSLRGKELVWQWAHETLPSIWERGFACSVYSDVEQHLEDVDLPVLIIHGQADQTVPPSASEYLHQQIKGSKYISIPDSGHAFPRTWPQVSRHILEFLRPATKAPASIEDHKGAVRVLWISSPIGLGHVKRDVTIANEIRKTRPDMIIEWLAINPVKDFLEKIGEKVHPLSNYLRDESSHFESHGMDFSLNVTEAYWAMDKILNNNFMVFSDAVQNSHYDLVVGDESWDVVKYLHYNPSLKTTPFVFLTDFIGAVNVSEDKTKQAHVYNVNATWVEMRDIHPEASDLSIFIGELEDIPDISLGEGLPDRVHWARDHFEFIDYILPFEPADYEDLKAIRTKLGFSPEDKILLIAVGGTSVGRSLIEKCLEAIIDLDTKIPHLRTLILCGPRIDSQSFGKQNRVEFKSFVPNPIDYYAACDLAIIQGGLATAMELTALNRPFLYFPLRDHFEQLFHVPFRLKRYKAGIRMDFNETGPSELTEAIVDNIGKPVNFKPVDTGGAKKAASMILNVLNKGE
jgi:pimeloyl-ACP methyl ester carboxylesterase/predicted glycosyltransferase